MTNKFDYQIEILQAAKEGKPIQWRSRTSSKQEWMDEVTSSKEGVLLDFSNYEFRVKKEPDVFYLVEFRNHPNQKWEVYTRQDTKGEAEKWEVLAKNNFPYTRIRKFVEVPDDED